MWLIIGLFIVVAYLGYLYYTRVYLTKQTMEYYHQVFTKAGYRVKFIPFKLFSFGSFDQLIVDQEKHKNPSYTLENHCQQYDMVVGSCFNYPMIEFFNADLIQAQYNSNINNYVKFDPIVGSLRRIGNGLAFSEGDNWRKKRRIISSVFHFDFLSSLVPKMNENIDETFKRLDSSQPGEEKKPGQLLTFYLGIVGDIMMRFFFGAENVKGKTIDGVEVTAFLNKLVTEVNYQGLQLPAVLFGRKFLEFGLRKKDRDINRRIKLFREFAFDLIRSRVAELNADALQGKTSQKGNDMIESMCIAKSLHDKTKTDDAYDYMELIEEFVLFFAAGTDTVQDVSYDRSHLLAMICLYLQKNPATKVKLMQEIDQVITTDADITTDNLKKLDYMTAVINETGRMYGPGNAVFARQVVEDYPIKDVQVKVGTVVNMSFIPNNYNPLYYKNPFEFNPQRWLNENKVAAHPYMFIPFSNGPRNCIGQHMAMLETKLILVKVMRHYDWYIENPEKVHMTLGFIPTPTQFDITMRPKQPVNQTST